jgi:hypothetical protein
MSHPDINFKMSVSVPVDSVAVFFSKIEKSVFHIGRTEEVRITFTNRKLFKK